MEVCAAMPGRYLPPERHWGGAASSGGARRGARGPPAPARTAPARREAGPVTDRQPGRPGPRPGSGARPAGRASARRARPVAGGGLPRGGRALLRRGLRRRCRRGFAGAFLAAAPVFFAVAFFAVLFLAAAFFAAVFFGRALGPLVGEQSTPRSGVIVSTSSSLRRVALVSPSVTYGPKRPSLTTTGFPLTGSVPSSLSGGLAAARPRCLGWA